MDTDKSGAARAGALVDEIEAMFRWGEGKAYVTPFYSDACADVSDRLAIEGIEAEDSATIVDGFYLQSVARTEDGDGITYLLHENLSDVSKNDVCDTKIGIET